MTEFQERMLELLEKLTEVIAQQQITQQMIAEIRSIKEWQLSRRWVERVVLGTGIGVVVTVLTTLALKKLFNQ